MKPGQGQTWLEIKGLWRGNIFDISKYHSVFNNGVSIGAIRGITLFNVNAPFITYFY